MKLNNLFTLFVILVIGCSETTVIDKKWNRVSFPELSQVIYDSFKIEPVNNFPVAMLRKDSLMIIKNNKSDTIFRVLSLPEFEYLGWFGRIGRGPNEFLVPPHIRNYNGFIQMSGVRKISLIDLPYGNVKNNFRIIEEYLVPGNIIPLNEVFTLNDNKYYGIIFGGRKMDIAKRKELVFFNSKTYATGSLIDFPLSLFKGLPNRSFMHPKCIAVTPNNDKFAFFYSLYPLMRIFDKDTNILKEIWVDGLPKQIKFKNIISRASDNKVSNLVLGYSYYRKVISTDKYLYALFSNDKGVKTGPGKFSYGRKLISNPELHVFTWEGKPVFRIPLRKGVSAFELSEDERYLYCTDADVNDKIYRYDLNPCFKKNY